MFALIAHPVSTSTQAIVKTVLEIALLAVQLPYVQAVEWDSVS
jgi:hypothetical protein